jgi:hypothetical protein
MYFVVEKKTKKNKNNQTDKHIHTHKKRYLEVISRSTRFKEFNREKKTATKTSNMFKIVPRIGTCDEPCLSQCLSRKYYFVVVQLAIEIY